MMEDQTTSPRQEDVKSKSKLTLQNRILNLGKATEIYSEKGTASLEDFAPVMEALTQKRGRKVVLADASGGKAKQQHLSFSQRRLLAGRRKILVLALVALVAIASYLFIGVKFGNPRLFSFAMGIRTPKVLAMIIAAVAVGGSSIVFQSIVNNTIVTPCLLGMNSLYTLIHTATVFVAGSASLLATNANLSFGVDLVLMAVVATTLYSYLFKKTGHNVLYVLLIGTVLTSFFGSIQSTMIRVMDPNEYDALLASLVASFSNVNGEIILFSVVVLAAVAFFLRKDLALLDVLTLGKHQATNLGIDYDTSVRRLLVGVSLCIATATAMVGPISFLGLIVANLSRQMMKTFRHSHLILASSLLGVVVLVGGQLVVERFFSYSVPISVFVTFGGGMYFLYLLMKKKRG